MGDEFDSPWKEVIEGYFGQFLHFYFPQVFAEVDWNQPYLFLDKELLAVGRDAEIGTRYVDKLARVTRRDGSSEWIYLHLEVQGAPQEKFAERMFVYHYRLYDRYRQPIVSLALLTDDRASWRPDTFGYDVCGCQLRLHFPVAKLVDWIGADERLADSRNPFAFITRVHLNTRSTRNKLADRYATKRQLLLDLRRYGWEKQVVLDLYRILDWMMHLPDDLEREFWGDVLTVEENEEMTYVTSFERIGFGRGFDKGLVEGELRVFQRVLGKKFGELPVWVEQRLEGAQEADLLAWTDAVLTADSLEAVFGSPDF